MFRAHLVHSLLLEAWKWVARVAPLESSEVEMVVAPVAQPTKILIRVPNIWRKSFEVEKGATPAAPPTDILIRAGRVVALVTLLTGI